MLYMGTRSGHILNFRNEGQQEIDGAWQSLREAARYGGGVAAFAEVAQRLKEFATLHRRLRQLMSESSALKDLRNAFAECVRLRGKMIENTTQFNSIRDHWEQFRLNSLTRWQAFLGEGSSLSPELRALDGLGRNITTSIGRNSWGELEKNVDRFDAAIAQREANVRQSLDNLIAELVSFSDDTLGKFSGWDEKDA